MQGEGHHAPNALLAVEASYEAGVTDEFIEPVVIDGTPRIEPGDTAIFFNFRPDRARQLSRALLAAGVDLTTMTRYQHDIDSPRHLRGADGRGHARRGARRRPGSASCTRRRPRSTPTSRISSTEASRSRGPARTGSSSRARATCRATTSSRRCRPRSWPTGSAPRSATATASALINFANPDMVGHTGRDPGRRRGGRDDRPLPRARGRHASPSSAACA